MIGDPNWLYSTIAQSSAAIVAIVGGFITASVLMLTSEKRGLKNQLADKKAQLQALKEYGDVITPISLTRTKNGKVQPEMQAISVKQEDVSRLETEISDLEKRLKTFAYPPNLGWGLVVLGCFAFAGIVLPIMVIMIEIYSMQIKQFIFILFFWGLAAILGYIAFQLRELRR